MAGTRKIAIENGKKGGRPLGSKTRPRFCDFITEKEVFDIIETAKRMAREGDSVMLKFVAEQVFGKASQSMDITTGGEKINTFDDEQIERIARRVLNGGAESANKAG